MDAIEKRLAELETQVAELNQIVRPPLTPKRPETHDERVDRIARVMAMQRR